MLKNIDPILTPDLLKVLCEMGHGDEVAVVDANFTAMTLAAGKPVLRLSGAGLREACAAVLSVFPLDADVAQPVGFMRTSGQPTQWRSGLQADVIDLVARETGLNEDSCEGIERFAFYDRVKRVYAIVQTGEMEPFGNFIFKKGVITAAL